MIPLNAVPVFDVITRDSTGVKDADSAPTFDVYEDTTDTGMLGAQTMTKRTGLTGDYRGTFTASAGNGFEVGKWYNVIATGTVGGVTDKTVVMTFRLAAAENAAGVPEVDVKSINNISTSGVTAVNANIGTTQPQNFTGTGASALVKVDAIDWAGTAITASSIPVATAAGAAGGLLISGSNSGTTTLGALTVTGATTLTGNVSMAAGLNITQSSSNASALVVTGNGTGHGAIFTSGSGATGDGARFVAASTDGRGLSTLGHGTGEGLRCDGGVSGEGAEFTGGTNQDGAKFTSSGGSSVGIRADSITVTNAVTFSSTFTVSGATSLAAVTTSGTVTFNAFTVTNAFTVSGTMTLTGAVTATNASNDIRGIALAANQHVIVDSGTVTTVTNQLTAAQIATGVWQDTTAGDFTVASSIGKSLYTTGNAPGAASGLAIVGSNMGTVTSVTGNVAGSIGSLAAQAKADVNAEVVDVIRVDTNAEPTGAPAATDTLQKKLDFLYEALRNKITVSASAKTFFNDSGSSQWSKATSDDGTTYTEAEGA